MDFVGGLQRRYLLWRAESGPCSERVVARAACQREYGRESALCTRLKLDEKKCLAQELCPREALHFYGGERPCAAIVERFCGPESENDSAEAPSDPGAPPRKIPKRCRWASYELGQCLHQHTRTRPNDPR